MAKSKTARLRRAREKMIARDPHCWYCGIEVVEVEHHQRHSGEPKRPRPRNAATIEHVFHRLRGPRPVPGSAPAQGAWLLACEECNFGRNRYSELLAGIDVLRQRASRHPCACGCGEAARGDFAYKRGHGVGGARRAEVR